MVVGSSLAGDSYGNFSMQPNYPTITINNRDTLVAQAKADSAPARISLEVPANAKVYVDGAIRSGEGTTRHFHTPDLLRNQTYYYDVKAEAVIDGKTVIEEKKLLVRGGDALEESFPKLLVAAQKFLGADVAKK